MPYARQFFAEFFRSLLRKHCGVEGLLRELSDGLFDFYGVHGAPEEYLTTQCADEEGFKRSPGEFGRIGSLACHI
jgi:hypothetical protein